MKNFRGKPLLHILLIAVLGLIAYSNTFDVPFTFDDGPNISQNPIIRDISNIPAMFAGKAGPFASRPLLHATAAINYHFGGVDVRGYHALNLALHLLNGALLYLLIAATGRHMRYPERETSLAALFSAALFVLHPVQTEAVTYVVSRSMLFATAFYLLGMLLFLKAATSEGRRPLYIAALAVVSLLGMGSREDFATFPMMLLLYDLFFISEFRFKAALRHWKAYLPVLMSLGYLAHLVLNNTYDRVADYPTKNIPHLEYALTQFSVHATYLRLFLLPVNQNLDYDYPIAQTVFEFPAVFSFIGYMGLLVGGILLARKRPLISFAVLWFLAVLLPISFGVTLFRGLKLDDVIFEHRAYLPLAGLTALAGAAASALYGKLQGRLGKAAGVSALVVLAVSFSTATYARNSVWLGNAGLWEDAGSKSPGKARTHFNLGVAYGIEGRREEAMEQYRTAMYLAPDDPNAYVNLGNLYRAMGMEGDALEYYKTALRLDPDNPEASKGLGAMYASQGMLEQAMRQYMLALNKNPNDVLAHVNLGVAYKKLGQDANAAEHFKAALTLSPGIVESFVNHGMMYFSMGQDDMALEQLDKAVSIDPGNQNAHIHLGLIYQRRGDNRRAEEHFAVANRP